LEQVVTVVPFCFQLAPCRRLINNNGLTIGRIMEELQTNGGSTDVRPDEDVFLMMQLPADWHEVLLHYVVSRSASLNKFLGFVLLRLRAI